MLLFQIFEVTKPIKRPATESCTVTLVPKAEFPPAPYEGLYYNNYTGSYSAPDAKDCGEDWSLVVLDWDATSVGRQYDRYSGLWLGRSEVSLCWFLCWILPFLLPFLSLSSGWPSGLGLLFPPSSLDTLEQFRQVLFLSHHPPRIIFLPFRLIIRLPLLCLCIINLLFSFCQVSASGHG